MDAVYNLMDNPVHLMFLRRTQKAFNHSGIYVTETKTLFGAYDPCTYGTAADKRTSKDLPFGYKESV